MVHSGPGISYLEMCKAGPGSSDVSSAQSAAEGLRRVLDGRQEHFSMEYPCHSPTEERWFVMHARRLYGETMGAVVSHVNITAWRQEAAS
jgi:two-component system CheB/CheR fusion protein